MLTGLVIAGILRWRGYHPVWNTRHWLGFAGLLAAVPVTALFIGLQLQNGSSLPLPGLPADTPGPALMPFSTLPWTIAAGTLGPIAAAALGFVSGLLRGIWDSHSLFTSLILALLGVLYSAAVRQRYRTLPFRLLRQPLLASLAILPIYSILYLIGTFFSVPAADATVTVRLDYAISNVGTSTLAMAGELLVSGLINQIFALAIPALWGRQTALQPSPGERSLETRFLFGTGTFLTILLLTLLIGDWLVAGSAARRMLADQMESAAQMASDNVPFFLETGQNLGAKMAADPRLLTAVDPELSAAIGEDMQSITFFEQVAVVDATSGQVLGYYPADSTGSFSLYQPETSGLAFTNSGVRAQVYTIPPSRPQGAARVTFLLAIIDPATSQPSRILIGRADLGINPLTQPLINNLKSMPAMGGSGILLDEDGRILYDAGGSLAMTDYPGQRMQQAAFYDETGSDGTRNLVYFQPVKGRPWAIVLTVPAQRAQQMALNIAAPLSIMILVLALIAMISLRLGLRIVTRSLQSLAFESNRIAQGQLDHPLQVQGVDEVAQLRRAFEQMRVSLKDRIEELNRLLAVSLGASSSLEMQESVQPVLEAVLATGASAARVVLSPAILPDPTFDMPTKFALGQARDKYAHLDEQILQLTQRQEKLIAGNLVRTKAELTLDPSRPNPAALLAVALRHENRYYGVLWAAYDQPRQHSEADLRFFTTLAGQAALATANAFLFLNVEVSRRQLEAILDSTPDPVLVTDHHNRLLLANPAAGHAFGESIPNNEGKTIHQALNHKVLLDLLQSSAEKQSAEITLPDGQTYLATASPVIAEGRTVGRVCILRDVSHFKELDSIKSEFVATVSHDLRSPLTLMRGYATMLEMVGQLNEQQQGYVRKMISGVENMSRLVNNLLDLGRIEIGVGLNVETVQILDIIERVTGALQLQANQKNISLSVEMPRVMPQLIEADQALLHQAIYNLVENAIKYTPNGGKIVVRLRNDPATMYFDIQDNGIGISPADQARLFEKFYRGKQREALAQQGTGLGLAIVRSIAERHGGRVWVESEIGKGSTFHLQVPLTQPKETPLPASQ
jgi:signal transduction histidine kinase